MDGNEVIDIVSDTESNSGNSVKDIAQDCFDFGDYEDIPAIEYDVTLQPEQKELTSKLDVSEGSSDDTIVYEPDANIPSTHTESIVPKKRKSASKLRNNNRNEEKKEKKADKLMEKALKAAAVKKQRALKPEESLKQMKVLIDNGVVDQVLNGNFGGSIICGLQQQEIQYSIQPHVVPCSISWVKQVEDYIVGDDSKLSTVTSISEQDLMLIVFNWKFIVQLVHDKELLKHVQDLKSRDPKDRSVVVVIHGLEKYFGYYKVKEKRKAKAAVNGVAAPKPKKDELLFEACPMITRDDLEGALVELQLLGRCAHRLVETQEELSGLVLQYTKSLSQLELKQKKQQMESEGLEWFAKADSKDCVKVDKNGVGLARLWQQQVCQFTAVGIEVAQAIAAQYTSPLTLMTAYRACADAQEAELLLQHIPVRRNAGVLSSTRRVGPELSKKLFRFLTSDDPSQEL